MNQFDLAHAIVAQKTCVAACVDFFNNVDRENIHLCSKEIIDVYNAGEMASNVATRLKQCQK